MITIKDLIIDGLRAEFVCYHNNELFYQINGYSTEGQEFKYEFPIPICELEGATIYSDEKSILLTRWIKKALNNKPMRVLWGPHYNTN